MESLGLTITKEFFKERLDFIRWNENQQRKIEDLFDCDVYGGPMKVWNAERSMWQHFFKNVRSMYLFVAFANVYSKNKLRRTLEYHWSGEEFYDLYTETIKLNDNIPITDDNWITVVWNAICELEEKVN